VMPKIQFEEQLKYLKDNGYTTITAQEFINAYNGKINLPKKSIFLTLDDGFQSIKTVVNPLLKQYDMRATSFIIGSYINRPQWHLTVEDIKEVVKDKLVDFESHTFDLHKDGKSKGLINETPVNDIVADNKKLEEVIGHKASILCYPFGAFSKNAFDGLTASQIPFGFAIKSGASTWVHLNETHTTTKGEVQNPLALPRIRMNANTPISVFADLISEN
ncbi:MAG: polysaccharide deacetylase family protein, partial [Culicoidibacterales bacterium]